MIDSTIDLSINRGAEVPPAFYRDDEPPPPPPDDPHWREWPHHDGYEGLPRWIIYGLPLLMIAAVAMHCAVIVMQAVS